MKSPELFVNPCFASQTVEIAIKCESGWCHDAKFKKIDEGEVPPWFIRTSEIEAQALMDRLWKAGFRPTEGAGSAGALKATQHHLEDMRTLVFDSKSPKGILDDAIRKPANFDPDFLKGLSE
jgi:hypothetical protein